MNNINKILNLRSKNENILPKHYDIEHGEIAINYCKDHEFISIKNSNNDIVKFSSDTNVDLGGGVKKITHADLLKLKLSKKLLPGQLYRIIDYIPTTTQKNTMAVTDHPFDIVVLALDEKTLDENASAMLHEGNWYFSRYNCNLSKWELKYDIYNNKDRYYWADPENGKGVIYYMKDDKGNECHYDFKNIKFKKYLGYDKDKMEDIFGDFVYTFNDDYRGDVSVTSDRCTNNIIKPLNDFNQLSLNFITLLGEESYNNTFGDSCYNITCGYFCRNNIFGNNCNKNTFGRECNNNTFGRECRYNTFGAYCSSNTFGDNYSHNTMDDSCGLNTFGRDCRNNTFGDDYKSNSFGNNCYKITFDMKCTNNTFGNSCNNNTFGNNCNNNTFGDDCYKITFDMKCTNNTFGNSCNNNTFGRECRYNTFGNRCSYNSFGDECSSNSFGDRCGGNTFNKIQISNSILIGICQNNSFQKYGINKYENINLYNIEHVSNLEQYIKTKDIYGDKPQYIGKNTSGDIINKNLFD